MSQPRFKVSVNVSLEDILCIAEPFVTKPSMVRHQYKPECHMHKKQQQQKRISVFTVKVTVTEFRFIQWNMTISIICSELLIVFGDQLDWQYMFISWSVLWIGCFAVFKVKVTVNVLNFSECLPRQYLWSVKLSIVMYHHHQPEYHSEISFYYVQGQSHNRFYYIFRNTEHFGKFCNPN